MQACYNLTNMNAHRHVVTYDLESYQKLYDEHLSALPNVQRLISTMVMKNIISNRSVLF